MRAMLLKAARLVALKKCDFGSHCPFPVKRDYVAAVAAEVKKRLGRDAVFYDKDFTAQLARPNWTPCCSIYATTPIWSSYFFAQSTSVKNGVA